MPETTPTGPEASSAIDRLSLNVSSPRGSAVTPALGGGDWSPNNPMCFEAGPAVNGPHGTPNCVCFEAAASPGGFSACTGSGPTTCGYSCFEAE